MTNRNDRPLTDQYYLDIAHDLPGYNWEARHDGLGIGYGPKGAWNN